MNRADFSAPNTPTNPGQRYEVRFYPSNPLQPGNVGSPLPQTIPAWNIGEPLVALLYRRDSAGGEQLWVLTERSLRRYRSDFTFDEQGVPQVGTPAEREQYNQPLQTTTGANTTPVACQGGYIRTGVANFLVVCPPQRAADQASVLPTAWRIPYTAANEPLPAPIDLSAFVGNLPLRLALAQDRRGQPDQLLYLTPRQIGIAFLDTGPNLTEALNLPANLTNQNTAPSDLTLSPSNTALGLLAPPNTGGTLLLTWTLQAANNPNPVSLENTLATRLNGTRFAGATAATAGSSPVHVLGQSFARLENNALQLPPENLNLSLGYTAGLAATDQFLYLTSSQNATLTVVDLQIPTPNLTNTSFQQNFLSLQSIPATAAIPSPPPLLPALAFIPTAGAAAP
ncbi:MAG: hypothetical protein SFU83_17075 [Meiothermus sp.]|nr:hypothetical protein [Meiothermus sp.]